MNEYLDVNKENFQEKWSNHNDFSEQSEEIVIKKWDAIYKLFFGKDKKSKSDNIWFNEIREIGLYVIFIKDISVFERVSDTNQRTALESLQRGWKDIIRSCAEDAFGQVELGSLVKKGGRGFSHDFDLIIKVNGVEKTIPIEFKYSNTKKTSIQDLAQFNAINTESGNGKILFGEGSYLDHYWDNRYIDRVCHEVKVEKPTNKEAWKTTAKSTSEPKMSPMKEFHSFLRGESVSKNNQKKNIVNESFHSFIESKRVHIEGHYTEISEFLNAKQDGKYFCIFSGGNFIRDKLPTLVVSGFEHTPGKHFFHLICQDGIKIKCDMSWGNGGAGNQNPRVLIKLGNMIRGGGHGSMSHREDEISQDPSIVFEELAIGDKKGKEEQKELLEVLKGSKDHVFKMNESSNRLADSKRRTRKKSYKKSVPNRQNSR